MNLIFLNSALIGAFALIALPVLAHLVARARPPAYRFSDTTFLARVVKHAARTRRPKDWLLLLLRTLGLAALVTAFLLPTWYTDGVAIPGERRTSVIVVDRSGSMAAGEDDGVRFDLAVEAAADYLRVARPDAANLIWLDAEPRAVFPEPGPNVPMLVEELRRARSLPEGAAVRGALDLAATQLAGTAGYRELVIISDFRESAWKDVAPSVPEGVKVVVRHVARATPPNLSVAGLSASPATPLAGRPVRVTAKVRNHSGSARRSTLTVDAGGAVTSLPVDVPPGGEIEAAFPVKVAAPGPLNIIASLTPDAFPDDDRRQIALEARETLRLLVVSPTETAEVRTLRRFVAATPWLELDVQPAPPPGATPDFVVAPSWDGSHAEVYAAYAEAGRPVFLRPRDGVTYAALAAAGAPVTGAAAGVVPATERGRPHSATARTGSGVFALFESGEFGDPLAGKFRERAPFTAGSFVPSARILAAYTDGTPALVASSGGGAPVTVMNFSLDPAHAEWPSRGEFVPAFSEMLLRSKPEGALAVSEQPSGSRLAWSPGEDRKGVVTLANREGVAFEVVSGPGRDGPLWRGVERARPGLYQWNLAGRTERFAAVNLPEDVSELRPLATPPEFGVVLKSKESLARRAELGRGVPVWPWFLAFAVLCFLLESLVSGFAAGTSGARAR